MLLICGLAGGTGTTGTLYEPDETPPSYNGAPTVEAPYVWVCDAFYRLSRPSASELDPEAVHTLVGFEESSRWLPFCTSRPVAATSCFPQGLLFESIRGSLPSLPVRT
jgi:hypothetical protein